LITNQLLITGLAIKLDEMMKEISQVYQLIVELEDKIRLMEYENSYLLRSNASLDFENIHLQQQIDKMVDNINEKSTQKRATKRKGSVICENERIATRKKIRNTV
jgi:regulator of replication initiation timing